MDLAQHPASIAAGIESASRRTKRPKRACVLAGAALAMFAVAAAPIASGQGLRPSPAGAGGFSAGPNGPAIPLSGTIAEATFDDAPLERVLTWLSEQGRQNLVVRWEKLAAVGIERNTPVSLQVRSVTIRHVLWMVLAQVADGDVRLAFRADGRITTISTADDLGGEIVTRAYDITDLMMAIPRFRPTYSISLADAGGAGFRERGEGDDEGAIDELPEGDPVVVFGRAGVREFARLVMETVEPDSWMVNGGIGTVAVYRNTLIVRNSLAVHQALGGYTVGSD
ncbi:MAG: hypothetical protein IPM64_16565 [Phycisphaerales bacterium]|nr:hypothetical protein [Phycisphaerales bacterium]